jgi:HK97 family phage major capsid protein
MAVAYSSEGVEGTDDSVTFAQPALKPVRVMGFIPISRELTEDWGEFEAELGQLISDAKDDLESTKFTLGTGINEPLGLVTGATTTVTAAGSGSFALADLYSLEVAIPARFKARSVLFGNRAQWDRVRQFNVSGGAQVWVPRLTQGLGTGSNLNADVLGFGANEVSAMTGTITAGSKVLVLVIPGISRLLITWG